ncbi:MAG: hypothetical protein BIFFINMI_00563 [Phycisphaerae bacterium]|nr:hypothetical protein [Phycisphaerae bacterium]
MRIRHLTLRGSLLAALLLAGCQTAAPYNIDSHTIDIYRARAQQQRASAGQIAEAPRELARPEPTTQPDAVAMTDAMAPRQSAHAPVKLTLREALLRGLHNSYDIKVEGFNPAITSADLVTAEAAFDAVVFLNAQYSRLDVPTNSTFFGGGQSENEHFEGGVRKKLATGGTIEAKYVTDRLWSNQPFQMFNGRYDQDLTVSLTQPLLRNAGLDVNRAQIYAARNSRDMSLFAFRRQVIQTLSDIEQAFWNLYFARQSLAIQRALLAQTEDTLKNVEARLQFDTLQVNVSQSKSAVASRRADVIRRAADVKDAEDKLKNLLNDPDLPQDQDIPIIPADEPLTQRVELSPERELWTGMENRSELQEAKLNISNAAISQGVARNQLLPQLDLFMQFNTNGLKGSWSSANSQLWGGDYLDYVVGLSFEFPLGNRAAKAQERKARLQLDQAVTSYHNLAADILTEIQVNLRDVRTSYDEILANREAVEAARENLTTLVERREKLSPEYLNVQLTAQETLANARRALQSAIVNYNNAIIRLEQAKGTLLRFDKIDLHAGQPVPPQPQP